MIYPQLLKKNQKTKQATEHLKCSVAFVSNNYLWLLEWHLPAIAQDAHPQPQLPQEDLPFFFALKWLIIIAATTATTISKTTIVPILSSKKVSIYILLYQNLNYFTFTEVFNVLASLYGLTSI